ncbi:uncharacterized protein LOC114949976 [Acropora millepora]|uniref:uncharacterized protein LOC114949976 n=1 Tax=Acropora millepora TaxID=45264 RepID=UPI001CF48B9D|nr:uncharacterized protein LOC114949976 [Acropora millepora]
MVSVASFFGKMAKSSHSYHAAVIFLTCCIFLQACADNLPCKGVRSISGMMLRGHIFQEHNAANIMACGLLCNSNIRCQSINYVISRHLCELNNRTKEARPEDYVQDVDRVYLTRPSERVSLGFIKEVPATSCREIKASEGVSAVSGNYWLDSIKPGQVTLVSCDMHTGDIDECASGTHNCINETADCTNTLGSYKFSCKPECKNYEILSSADRKVTHGSSPLLYDDSLAAGWYRFLGAVGVKMPTSCISVHRCGTYFPGWLNGIHPEEYEGNVTRQACFHYQTCCHFFHNIQVRNCSGYYVYYLMKTISYARYCGTD